MANSGEKNGTKSGRHAYSK